MTRTPLGEKYANRIYDIVAREDFNPDHAIDIRKCVEDAIAEAQRIASSTPDAKEPQ